MERLFNSTIGSNFIADEVSGDIKIDVQKSVKRALEEGMNFTGEENSRGKYYPIKQQEFKSGLENKVNNNGNVPLKELKLIDGEHT
jgi:hypothetical protein